MNIVLTDRTCAFARATTVTMFVPGHSGRSAANAIARWSLPLRFER